MVNIGPNNGTKKPNIGLWLLLTIAIALTAWTALTDKNSSDNDLVETTHVSTQSANKSPNVTKENKTTAQRSTQESNTIPWDSLNRQVPSNKINNLFSVHSWEVIPPVRHIKPPPPPPPVAPPAPFTYMGKMEGGPKGTLIFLLSNNKVYSISKGEKINTFWQLDEETETSLKMTYLPLNLPQILYKNIRNTTLPSNTIPMEVNQ